MELTGLFSDSQTLIDTFIKIGVSVGFVIYLIFAFVVVKQVNTMIKTLEVGLERPIQLIAIFHLLFALATFGIALIML